MTPRMRPSSFARRLPALALTAFALAGCATMSGDQGGFGSFGAPEGPRVSDSLVGSGLAGVLGRDARRAQSAALIDALNARVSDGRAAWTAPDGGRGTVRAHPVFLVGIEGTLASRLEAPLDLSTDYVIEPQTEPVVTIANTNIRLGPDTRYARSTTVPEGQRLTVHGKVQNADWMLVSNGVGDDRRILGYVFRELIGPAPEPMKGPLGEQELLGGQGLSLAGDDPFAEELTLAGGEARQPVLCRDVDQTYNAPDAPIVEWSATACRAGAENWRMMVDVVGFGS